MSWTLDKIRRGLERTRRSLSGRLGELFGSGRKVDEELLEELEQALLEADVGLEAATSIVATVRGQRLDRQISGMEELRSLVVEDLRAMLPEAPEPVTPERREEARAHLEADRVHEEDQTELAGEVEDVLVDADAEVPEQQPGEENAGDAEADTPQAEAAQHEPRPRHEGEDEQGPDRGRAVQKHLSQRVFLLAKPLP